MAFSALESSDHVGVLVSIDVPSNSKWNALCHRTAYDYSHADWMVVMVFKLGASVAASEFCEWVQAGIDVYNYTSS